MGATQLSIPPLWLQLTRTCWVAAGPLVRSQMQVGEGIGCPCLSQPWKETCCLAQAQHAG